MKTDELRNMLEEQQIDSKMYTLKGKPSPDSFVLSQEGFNTWIVYFNSKTGQRTNLMTFSYEEKACNELLQRIQAACQKKTSKVNLDNEE